MRAISLKVLVAAALLTATGAVLANSNSDEETLKAVRDYRHWARLTAKPIVVDFSSVAG